MKSTEAFKNVIEAHLTQLAQNDPLFAVTFAKEGKSIDNCITYILNTVHKSGCNGFTDAEIFGMASHYYDEDKIEVGKAINANVVVNHHVELSDQEKKEAKEEAIRKVIAEEEARLRRKSQPVVKEAKVVTFQPTLF